MSKNYRKSGQKVLQREFFFVSCGEFFLARAAKKCPKNMSAKFQGRAIFVPGVFSKEGHSTIMDKHSSSPKSFLSRPPKNYLLLLCIYGMPTRFVGGVAARSAKKLATCHSRLSRLGVAPCTIGMSTSITAGNPCFSRQIKALVTSFLAISFYMFLLSSLLSA